MANPALRTSYYMRDNSHECETTKRQIRDLVVKFLLKYHDWNRLRYLGLPGLGWKTERLLGKKFGSIRFAGVEWCSSIATKCATQMPRRSGQRVEKGKRCWVQTKPRYTYFYQGDGGLLINAPASRVLNWDQCSFKPGRKDDNRAWLSYSLFNFTCVWLDFCAPFGSEIMACCRQLGKKTRQDCKVPFAVTISLGRERPYASDVISVLGGLYGSAVDVRARAICNLIKAGSGRPVDLEMAFKYRSPSGSSMGVILGVLGRSERRNSQWIA